MNIMSIMGARRIKFVISLVVAYGVTMHLIAYEAKIKAYDRVAMAHD